MGSLSQSSSETSLAHVTMLILWEITYIVSLSEDPMLSGHVHKLSFAQLRALDRQRPFIAQSTCSSHYKMRWYIYLSFLSLSCSSSFPSRQWEKIPIPSLMWNPRVKKSVPESESSNRFLEYEGTLKQLIDPEKVSYCVKNFLFPIAKH